MSNLAKVGFHSLPCHPLSEHLFCSMPAVDPMGILRNKCLYKIRKKMWDFELGDLGWDLLWSLTLCENWVGSLTSLSVRFLICKMGS